MEDLSNKYSIKGQMANNNTNINKTSTNKTAERILNNLLESFPPWDINAGMMPNNESPPRNDFFINHFLGPIETPADYGIAPIGTRVRNNKLSPESSNNSSVSCNWCDVNASLRCVDCNEFMCNDCTRVHGRSPYTTHHSFITLPAPIGTSPTGIPTGIPRNIPPIIPQPQPQSQVNYVCDLHNEMYRYVCDYCKKLVCQCCTLHEHKEHLYDPLQTFIDEVNDKINVAVESSRMGTKCIKAGIDKALAFIRLIERNCSELCETIRKAFRQFIIAIEDRERFLLDCVEKLRQRRLANLHDQMAGLKSALSGLSETSDMMHKICQNSKRMDHIEIATKVTYGQRQLEQFAAIYKDLQPRQEIFTFAAPDYSILQDIRNQGSVIVVDEKIIPAPPEVPPVDIATLFVLPPPHNGMTAVIPTNLRRPLLRDNSFHNQSPIMPSRTNSCTVQNGGIEWEHSVLRSSPGLQFGAPRSTQAIAGSTDHIKARKSNALSLSFATEGHEDGQVSRPWGLCVDKMGHILISDRRNNRVQVFHPDSTLKLKFGRKGVGNGEFDLPAGICVDTDNRIIVVDKDNHRVQIFTSSGVFLIKFGSYGKEYGQFQYPWDVAVNSRRQIVVSDSRNHRIQQFDSEGRFIRQIVFDNHGQNKGIASPRGVCYTPTGNIIVSDFDNHCLYLIDPDINEILSAKGHEGSGFQEFNRPSGLCCDDDGRIIVADSKNQRIVVFSPSLDYLWDIEVRPSHNPLMPATLDEKDRTCDVALMPDGRIVFLIELSPDSKEGSNPYKRFVHVF